MQYDPIEGRREALIAQLNDIREAYQICLNDINSTLANNGTEWSIADLLRHVISDTTYKNMTHRLLDEDSPNFERSNPDAVLENLINQSLGKIDEALAVANKVTLQQLTKSGTRRSQPYAVIDSLESWANHFKEHLTQLRNEVRPREDLPSL